MRVLLVEDEIRLAEALAYILNKHNYGVDLAGDGVAGRELAETGVYDLIILDRMLPRKEGLQVLKELRATGIETPVLILTAKDAVKDRVEGLDAGADDYLIKPFSNEELLARVRALSRRGTQALQEDILSFASLTFSPRNGEVRCGAALVRLTHKESQLLELLFRNKSQIVTKDLILDKVWGLESEVEMNNIEVNLSLLRRKLKSLQCPVVIETVRGLGYRLKEGKKTVK